MTLINSTITDNSTDPDYGHGGSGIYSRDGDVTIRNTIIAGNRVEGGEGPDCSGVLASVESTLIQNLESCFVQSGSNNLFGVEPKLGPLRNNGGQTLTHALLAGSPAIDAGNPNAPGSTATACAATDQRGVARPQDGNADGQARCDIGAYEVASTAEPQRYRVFAPYVAR